MPTKREQEAVFVARRRKLLRRIGGAVAVFPAAAKSIRSRDAEYSYQQDSDFFYLTGFEEPEAVLVLRAKRGGPRSVLFLRDRDTAKERWEGERLGCARAKRRFQVDEVRAIENFSSDLPKLVAGTERLYYAPGANSETDDLVWSLLKTTVGPRESVPTELIDSRVALAELRFVKDRHEVRALRHAIDITTHSFLELGSGLRKISSEAHAAQTLESHFARYGASGSAFQTIVASGKNATFLHHTPSLQPLWKREMVLVDAGARFAGYSADITRCFPMSGKFSEEQAEVYDIVLAALRAAIRRAKPKGTLGGIHEAAVGEITRGLVGMGLLDGDPKELIKDGAYKRFFMHGTSHFLGLDTHDVSPVRYRGAKTPLSSRNLPLVAGNVFTVEPGIYFDPKDTSIPEIYRGIGVRLEEDVLITSSGCEVLSKNMPIERDDIEHLMK